jgi:pimeloyl-ACP methyl ester carboxylesterase
MLEACNPGLSLGPISLTKSMPTFHTSRGLVEYRFDKRRPECVLLFNGGHTNPNMRDSEQYFIDRNYSVISVARPGYCKTESRIDKSFGDFEHSVCELLDHLGIDIVNILGVSAGGRPAMRFAQLHPERCSNLILFSSTSFTKWPDIGTRLTAYISFNPFMEKYTWAVMRWALRTFPQAATELLFASLTKLNAKQVLASYTQRARNEILRLFMEFRSGSGFMNDISSWACRGDPTAISASTLIVHSKFDRAVAIHHPSALAQEIPNARLIINDTESHLMWMSPHWDKVERELNRFLA